MIMNVKGKICIITGSAQGLGKAFATILLDNGAKVCISDLYLSEVAESTIKEFKNRYGKESVCFVKCDVTKEDQFEALFNETESYFKVDCIDMLVNNAGINTNMGWKKCMEVNIMGVMTGTDIALQRMKKSTKTGTIVNIASMAGIVTGVREEAIGYYTSKHGVVALTRTLANDYSNHGVSIKAICPAFADTTIVSSALASLTKENEKQVKANINRMGGLMTPEYVAEGFYKLVTELGNGSVIWAFKDTPFLVIPDYSFINLIPLFLMARIGKIVGKDVITIFHQRLLIFVFIILTIILFRLFL